MFEIKAFDSGEAMFFLFRCKGLVITGDRNYDCWKSGEKEQVKILYLSSVIASFGHSKKLCWMFFIRNLLAREQQGMKLKTVEGSDILSRLDRDLFEQIIFVVF
ncbi:hypothetical protein HI914_03030 [Erysiphe necator]|nr:hypothetical protein HI914_03030 [Erysiphe necator]